MKKGQLLVASSSFSLQFPLKVDLDHVVRMIMKLRRFLALIYDQVMQQRQFPTK